MSDQRLRIGYLGGQAKKINERAIDSEWIAALGTCAELVPVSPMRLMRASGGNPAAASLPELTAYWQAKGEGLRALCSELDIGTLYVNVPAIVPGLLMARNAGNVPLNLFLIAHSVGSEYWLRQWVAIAPLLRPGDTLLCATDSAKEALLNISPVYAQVFRSPLCLYDMPDAGLTAARQELKRAYDGSGGELQLLCLGRLDRVKNVHSVIEVCRRLRQQGLPVHLTLAGEYTGSTPEAVEAYRAELTELAAAGGLESAVSFAGPVSGDSKRELLERTDLLLNFSTDPGETFGYVLIEAKAWGIPVVCTRWDGFQELLEPGADGAFVDVHWPEAGLPELDLEQAVQIIAELLGDRERWHGMAQRALAGADTYGYHSVMPGIAAELARQEELGQAEASVTVPELERLLAPLSAQPEIYTTKVAHSSFGGLTPLDVLNSWTARTDDEWLRESRSFIAHFAGSSHRPSEEVSL